MIVPANRKVLCLMARYTVKSSYLQEYLGLKVFDSAMHVYFERWKFKHPYPEDLKAVLEEG